ncbi:MAG: Mur ligase family protein [Cyclobacteriaceae bacterium]
MKLHFTTPEDYPSNQMMKALSGQHEISSNPDSMPPDPDGLVLASTTSADYPDINKAKSESIPVLSIPELIYKLSTDKQRIVIAGSHGKSSIAKIIFKVLTHIKKPFDYALWEPIEDIDCSVKISDAPIIIIEGSEGPASKIDTEANFHKLNHHIAMITDLAHKHKEVYPAFDDYVKEFDRLADATPKAGTLVYNEEDALATVIGGQERPDVKNIPFSSLKGIVNNDIASIQTDNGSIEIMGANEFSLLNLAGAKVLLNRIGVTHEEFFNALKTN